jgi:hypothetical protein
MKHNNYNYFNIYVSIILFWWRKNAATTYTNNIYGVGTFSCHHNMVKHSKMLVL